LVRVKGLELGLGLGLGRGSGLGLGLGWARDEGLGSLECGHRGRRGLGDIGEM